MNNNASGFFRIGYISNKNDLYDKWKIVSDDIFDNDIIDNQIDNRTFESFDNEGNKIDVSLDAPALIFKTSDSRKDEDKHIFAGVYFDELHNNYKVYYDTKQNLIDQLFSNCTNNSYSSNDKKGITSIGFIENFKTYLIDWGILTGYKTLKTEYIDEQFNNKNFDCYDRDGNSLEKGSQEADLMVFETGELFKENNSKIFEGIIKGNGSYSIAFGDIETLKSIVGFDITIPNISTVNRYFNSLITNGVLNEIEFTDLLRRQYNKASEQNLFVEYNFYDSEQKNNYLARCFDSEYVTCDGERIFFKTTENHNPNASKKWYGISCITEESIWNEYFDEQYYHFGRIVLKDKNEGVKFLDNLSEIATHENWSYPNNPYEKTILRNYISNTLERLLNMPEPNNNSDQSVTCYNFLEYNNKCFFNTGLLDDNFKEVFLCVDKVVEKVKLDNLGERTYEVYKNPRSYSDGDGEARGLLGNNERLNTAKYFEKIDEVIFQCSKKIELNYDHIFNDGLERNRIPRYADEYKNVKSDAEKLRELQDRVKKEFTIAKDRAVMLATRNYKLAVPQYRSTENKIQFLLPIYLGEGEDARKPQCALVLDYDDTTRVPCYIGTTILTIEMAYNNARLIAKPDAYWLDELYK